MSFLRARQQAGPPPDLGRCHENNKSEILGVTGFMMTAAAIAVLLRVYVRVFMLKSFGADDYVMVAALFMAVATFICFVGEADYAVGKHIECITPRESSMFSLWQYFHSLWIMMGVVLVKISVALFLLRLVPPTKQWKIFLWIVIVFLIAFMTACAGTIIFACVPIEASWNYSLRAKKGTRCFSNDTYTLIGLINSSINCATDFLLAILPIPVVIKLQVNRRTKVILAVILSLGYFACAAGIVKAVKQHSFFEEPDPLWANDFNVWNMIECCVGILAASLPSLRPLFARVLEAAKTGFTGRSEYSSRRLSLSFGARSRHLKDEAHVGAPGDVKMEDWQHSTGTNRSMSTTRFEPDHGPAKSASTKTSSNQMQAGAREMRYAVGVMSGRDPGPDPEWEDIEFARSQSEETLTRHVEYGIMKTVDMSQYEEHR